MGRNMQNWLQVQNGTVANVVLWDGDDGWAPPGDATMIAADDAPRGVGIGWLYDGQTFTAPVAVVAEPPAEIAMHKVRKALKQLGPDGAVTAANYDRSWWKIALAAIDGLDNPIRRDSIMDELNTAPNMVLAGASTQMIKAAIGMSDAQLETVARLALTLP